MEIQDVPEEDLVLIAQKYGCTTVKALQKIVATQEILSVPTIEDAVEFLKATHVSDADRARWAAEDEEGASS